MATNADIFVASKDLISTLEFSFLLKSQVATLKSFLLELNGHLIKESTDTWPIVNELAELFRGLMYFFRVNFIINERAPKELPVLRKLRTVLNVSELAAEYNKSVDQLEKLVNSHNINSKFEDTFLEEVFSPKNTATRVTQDVRDTLKEFIRICSHNIFSKDKDLLHKLESAQLDMQADATKDGSASETFSFFDRSIFTDVLADIDDKLLIVNRNIVLQDVVAGNRPQKRLQHALSESDLDFNAFEDDESVLDRFKGVWGEFSFAQLTPPLTKYQRKQNIEAVPIRVLVQVIPSDEVEQLTTNEKLYLGFSIRELEMNPVQVASDFSIMKYYGHFRVSSGDLIVVAEDVKLSLREVFSSNVSHMFSGSEVLSISVAISKALKVLHFGGHIHGEVRPENILFASGDFAKDIKLANFGHCLYKTPESFGQDQSRVAAYTAPEILRDGNKYEASDIYSFAIVIWSLLNPKRQAFSWKSTAHAEITKRVLDSNKPFLTDYGEYCEHRRENKFEKSEWDNMVEMMRFMWNDMPKDRPSSSLALDFFQQQLDAYGTSKKHESVFVLKDHMSKNPRETRRILETVDVSAPEPPPRAASVVSGLDSRITRKDLEPIDSAKDSTTTGLDSRNARNEPQPFDPRAGSKSSMQALRHESLPEIGRFSDASDDTNQVIPKNYQRFLPKSNPSTDIIKVSSQKHDGSLIVRRKKHDSEQSSKGKSAAFNRGHKLSVRESDETAPSEIGAKYTGFDGLRRSTVQKEIVQFKNRLLQSGKAAAPLDVEEETDFTMKVGLERFHFKMRIKHGIGLQRFADQDALWELPSGDQPKKDSRADSTSTKELLPAPRIIDVDEDDAIVGLNGMREHLKKRKKSRKKRLSINPRGAGVRNSISVKFLNLGKTKSTRSKKKRASTRSAMGSKNFRAMQLDGDTAAELARKLSTPDE